jgi:hypothetical protein
MLTLTLRIAVQSRCGFRSPARRAFSTSHQWERWKSDEVVVGTPLLSAGLRSAREERSFCPSTLVGPPLA